MPKDNPGAYRKIDSFIASLSPDEQRYLYGAVEAIIDGADNGEALMPEEDMEMAVDEAAPMPMSEEGDDMMADSGALKIPDDDDTTDYDKMFNA